MAIEKAQVQNTNFGGPYSEERTTAVTATYTEVPDVITVTSAATAAVILNVPAAAGRQAWQGQNKGQCRVFNESNFNATFTPVGESVLGNEVVPAGGSATFIISGGVWTNPAGSAASGGALGSSSIAAITTDVTNITNTMAPLTALSMNVVAGGVYKGRMVIKGNDSAAAEGIKFDFNGGTATATAFAAGMGLLFGGTTVQTVGVSSALATALIFTTITGESWIVIEFTLTVNAAGTFIPEFAQGTAHSAGTATVSRGTTLSLTRVA